MWMKNRKRGLVVFVTTTVFLVLRHWPVNQIVRKEYLRRAFNASHADRNQVIDMQESVVGWLKKQLRREKIKEGLSRGEASENILQAL